MRQATQVTYSERHWHLDAHLPEHTDILLITGGVNQYLYDSCGLLCVEAQYFEKIGKAIAEAAKDIPKIILTQAGGFEKDSHILFLDLASGIQKNLGGKQTWHTNKAQK